MALKMRIINIAISYPKFYEMSSELVLKLSLPYLDFCQLLQLRQLNRNFKYIIDDYHFLMHLPFWSSLQTEDPKQLKNLSFLPFFFLYHLLTVAYTGNTSFRALVENLGRNWFADTSTKVPSKYQYLKHKNRFSYDNSLNANGVRLPDLLTNTPILRINRDNIVYSQLLIAILIDDTPIIRYSIDVESEFIYSIKTFDDDYINPPHDADHPFSIIVEMNNFEILKLMVQRLSSIDQIYEKNVEGCLLNGLKIAIYRNNTQIEQYLIKEYKKYKGIPLDQKIPELPFRLIGEYAKLYSLEGWKFINQQFDITKVSGVPPENCLIDFIGDNLEIMQFLIGNGVDPNYNGPDSFPLVQHKPSYVRNLLKCGANPNHIITNYQWFDDKRTGVTPYELALDGSCQDDDDDLAKLLKEYGGSLEMCSFNRVKTCDP